MESRSSPFSSDIGRANAEHRMPDIIRYGEQVGTIEPGHGHILTYSVGENIAKGKVANIGSKKYTGFTSLNGAINKVKPKSFFILKMSK